MNLQYISDNKGKTTGVFIPIKDWEYLKNKFKELEKEEENMLEVPDWHKDIILKRLKEYHENPDNAVEWDDVQKEIKEKYGF